MITDVAGRVDKAFWFGKKVFLTGHTGFKGGWLIVWLNAMGAKVIGYSLEPNTSPNLFAVANLQTICEHSFIGDIRNFAKLQQAMEGVNPDIVIHMAAQPLVRYSYQYPIETYATNLMGTVHVLEAIRRCGNVKAALMVTTDKCYENKEWIWGYRETDPMGGYDPYSNSKGCAELAVSSYRQSFFNPKNYFEHGVAIATARAGNVIGGGDWSSDRLVPDAIRAFESGLPLIIRNPLSIRPWQHVLEPLSGYLVLAQALYQEGVSFNGAWNFGPNEGDSRSVKEVVELLVDNWRGGASWQQVQGSALHEAHFLKLDCSKARQELGWIPTWTLENAVNAVIEWHKEFRGGSNVCSVMHRQIDEFNRSIINLR
jgi:CDP-glucose 4,6-dehydratase